MTKNNDIKFKLTVNHTKYVMDNFIVPKYKDYGINYEINPSNTTNSIYITIQIKNHTVVIRLSDHETTRNFTYYYISKNTKMSKVIAIISNVLDKKLRKDLYTFLNV